MGYSFIYVILDKAAQRDKVQQLVLDRISTIRRNCRRMPTSASVQCQQHGMDLSVRADRSEGNHDLRETAPAEREPDQARLADGIGSCGGRVRRRSRRAVSGQIFPPLLANAGISLRQVISALKDVFQETGGRTIEVTNREYQLRGVINNDDIDKLEHLVVGRNREQSRSS
jgi:Cu(I)/Ag(I) efflux system membrane protein CusA/SilA